MAESMRSWPNWGAASQHGTRAQGMGPLPRWHLVHTAPSLTEQWIMLIVLSEIDLVMISNPLAIE